MRRINYLLLVFLIIPAFTSAQHTFSDADKWIPTDFNPTKYTLLIETYPINAKAENKMEDYLSKTYPWPYEIVTGDIIKNNSEKYADTSKYRFAFMWRTDNSRYGGPYDVDPNGNFYDRTTKKDYPTTRKINNYGQKSYMPFFNSIIKHFR
jgi:hypothetical protein